METIAIRVAIPMLGAVLLGCTPGPDGCGTGDWKLSMSIQGSYGLRERSWVYDYDEWIEGINVPDGLGQTHIRVEPLSGGADGIRVIVDGDRFLDLTNRVAACEWREDPNLDIDVEFKALE